MRKFLVMVLAAILICGGVVSVSAEEKDLHTYVVVEKNGSTVAEYKACQDGAFQYNPLWDGNAEITGLNEDIELPSGYEWDHNVYSSILGMRGDFLGASDSKSYYLDNNSTAKVWFSTADGGRYTMVFDTQGNTSIKSGY